MSSVTVSTEQWSRILDFLRECPDVYVGQEDSCKRFIEAVLWITRSGAQWRLLPVEYGRWNSIYKRLARWCDRGVWERMHEHFTEEPNMEYLIIDSTVVRAHQCAAGTPEKRGQPSQALGRSRGGFSTKVHVSVDGLGSPLRFTLTPGQKHDITQAEKLICGYSGGYLIADKGYDSHGFIEHISDSGMVAVIPLAPTVSNHAHTMTTCTGNATLSSVS